MLVVRSLLVQYEAGVPSSPANLDFNGIIFLMELLDVETKLQCRLHCPTVSRPSHRGLVRSLQILSEEQLTLNCKLPSVCKRVARYQVFSHGNAARHTCLQSGGCHDLGITQDCRSFKTRPRVLKALIRASFWLRTSL